MYLFWWIMVGLIAGWATGKIVRGAGYGVLFDIILGMLGAIVGGFVMRSLGFASVGGFMYTILVAIIGAALLVFFVRLLGGGLRT